jgi:hypothetical protein
MDKRIFWITDSYYGGDIDLIAQAARECVAHLVAVGGYSQEAYPGDREYVEGEAEYLFLLERPATADIRADLEAATKEVRHGPIRERVAMLSRQKYGE